MDWVVFREGVIVCERLDGFEDLIEGDDVFPFSQDEVDAVCISARYKRIVYSSLGRIKHQGSVFGANEYIATRLYLVFGE